MRRLYIYMLAALGLAGLGGLVLAQTQPINPVNPPVGSIWTYFGPTFGAGWGPPAGGAATAATCLDIRAYGGVGDNVVDNSPALQGALAAGRCVAFPAGKFRFASAVSYSFASGKGSLTICGQGQDVTELTWPNAVGNALTITLLGPENSFHLCSMTLSTGTLNADTAVFVNQTMTSATTVQSGFASSDVTRVTFRSAEGYASTSATMLPVITKGWKYGFRSNNASMVDFDAVHMFGPTPGVSGYHTNGGTGGTGIQVAGNSASVIPVIFNISRSSFNWLENGVVYGANVEGVTVSQSNFLGCYAGINAPPPGAPGMAQLAVTTSQFNCTYDILLNAAIANVLITNNLFYSHAGGAAIEMHVSSAMTNIVGNSFNGTTATSAGIGVSHTPSTTDEVAPIITGNSFFLLDIGIIFNNNNVSGPLVSSNFFKGVNQKIINLSYSGIYQITGAWDGAIGGPVVYAHVSGAVASPTGKVRLTVDDTTHFVNGQMVIASGVNGLNFIGGGSGLVSMIIIVDATHMDLPNVAFSGTYTSGGMVSSLPP
jgi:hypothetical protein